MRKQVLTREDLKYGIVGLVKERKKREGKKVYEILNELSKDLGITSSMVKKMYYAKANDKYSITLDQALRIKAFFGCTLSDIEKRA